jgi:hypothetical protein
LLRVDGDNDVLIPVFCHFERAQMVDYDGLEATRWWWDRLKKAERCTGLVLM